MILVDTSVWIDFLTGKETPFRRELHRLIEEGADVAICGTVLQEILQGIRSDKECHSLEKYLLEFRYLTLQEPGLFRQAAELYRRCVKAGKKVRKSLDCVIAAHAIQANAELFQNDRDFLSIAAISPLKIHPLNLH